MKIAAKTIKGKEFIYSSRSAHKVNGKNAEAIVSGLNQCGYMLKDNEKWHLYNIDKYDAAYVWAETQSFFISKNGSLKRKACAY